MEVRIVHREQELRYPETDYVRVCTTCDPTDDTVTLATIQRVVDKPDSAPASKPKRFVKTLVMERPMSPDAALGFATCYAERKKIPIVYVGAASGRDLF
jgi:hypothetical protein